MCYNNKTLFVKESEVMKRLLFLSLLAIFCLVPVLNGQAVDKAQVSSVRIATRNDAEYAFCSDCSGRK